MINYSIVMRSVNANLLEINQAKSRINQAKQEGKNHKWLIDFLTFTTTS